MWLVGVENTGEGPPLGAPSAGCSAHIRDRTGALERSALGVMPSHASLRCELTARGSLQGPGSFPSPVGVRGLGMCYPRPPGLLTSSPVLREGGVPCPTQVTES